MQHTFSNVFLYYNERRFIFHRNTWLISLLIFISINKIKGLGHATCSSFTFSFFSYEAYQNEDVLDGNITSPLNSPQTGGQWTVVLGCSFLENWFHPTSSSLQRPVAVAIKLSLSVQPKAHLISDASTLVAHITANLLHPTKSPPGCPTKTSLSSCWTVLQTRSVTASLEWITRRDEVTHAWVRMVRLNIFSSVQNTYASHPLS